MRSIGESVTMAGWAAAVAALAACDGGERRPATAAGAAAEIDSAMDSAAMVHDSAVALDFVPEAGDRQHLVRGDCPGPVCEVGPIVRIEPAAGAHQKAQNREEILARIVNEGDMIWVDGALALGPAGSGYDVIYVKFRANDDGTCSVAYSYRADELAVRAAGVDSLAAADTAGMRPVAAERPRCSLPDHRIAWLQPRARFETGSTAVWMSCKRGCCKAV